MPVYARHSSEKLASLNPRRSGRLGGADHGQCPEMTVGLLTRLTELTRVGRPGWTSWFTLVDFTG